MFHLALQIAGMPPQMAPASMEAKTMMTISSQLGILSPSKIMQAAVARPPMRIWPSPPTFQKRILNAGVTARDTTSKMAMF